MMTKVTKRALDTAVDELKRNGYMVLVIMLDQKKDAGASTGGVEVLCSETNDPRMLAAMLKTTLEQLTGQGEADRRIN